MKKEEELLSCFLLRQGSRGLTQGSRGEGLTQGSPGAETGLPGAETGLPCLRRCLLSLSTLQEVLPLSSLHPPSLPSSRSASGLPQS